MKNLKIKIKKPTRIARVLVMSRTAVQAYQTFCDYLKGHPLDPNLFVSHSRREVTYPDLQIIFRCENEVEYLAGWEFDKVVWEMSGAPSNTLTAVNLCIRPQYDILVDYDSD